MADLCRIKRPCDECPWRKDAEPGRFTVERWEALRSTSMDAESKASPEIGDPMFGCHKTPEGGERACAGWLAVEGVTHPNVRLALAMGALDPSAIEIGEGWPDLHSSFSEAASHDTAGAVA